MQEAFRLGATRFVSEMREFYKDSDLGFVAAAVDAVGRIIRVVRRPDALPV